MQTSKVYNKGKIERGIAFPTCISVNNFAGHVSPLSDAPDAISVGDVVKVDLAVHVDGYIAAVAQTAVVTGNADVACTGRAADVVCAAYTGAEVGPCQPAHRFPPSFPVPSPVWSLPNSPPSFVRSLTLGWVGTIRLSQRSAWSGRDGRTPRSPRRWPRSRRRSSASRWRASFRTA